MGRVPPKRSKEKRHREVFPLHGLGKLEDPKLIKDLEQILVRYRGWVFRKPPRDAHVILAISGGLDTTIMAALLMEREGYIIHPYFVRRGQRALGHEERAVDFFTRYFQKRYPRQFRTPLMITAPNPPLELKKPLLGLLYPLRDSVLLSYGIQYAASLERSEGTKIRTIFSGHVADDTSGSLHSTLTALRSFNVHVCFDTRDFSWQVTSYPLERTMGHYFGKPELIRWAYTRGFPLGRTRSCYEGGLMHCGRCHACVGRFLAFRAAGVPDPTPYAAYRQTWKRALVN